MQENFSDPNFINYTYNGNICDICTIENVIQHAGGSFDL